MQNDLVNELGVNFIEYAVAVNTDRAIPNATDGLKPVAKRILYGTFDQGFSSSKPHVKCANIVGNVMADWHPHGDSSIYGALVRMSQNWVMRYPLIDFHGSNGNIDGDGPAAYRYTEARLAKISEEGMLGGIKKDNVDFIPNYSETKEEPVELPSIFPNLLCNPNSGIGVAMACNWAPHNLKEVANAIYDYIDGNEPMLPGPDFPTGGVVINKDSIPEIMATGHGSVKIRAKYVCETDKIIFTEIPYGTGTEAIMSQIGKACDEEKIKGIADIRNESNKRGFRLVIECEKNAPLQVILNKLFAETDLQTSFAYNQVALVDKTPTELTLRDCIKIYVDHNSKCIIREAMFDIKKATERLHIIVGLLKALNNIDDIIALIKKSESAAAAKESLIATYGFSEVQAQAILDMKLSKLAKLEKSDLENEKDELEKLIIKLEKICENPIPELRSRLSALVEKYGDERRTELAQIKEEKVEKEIAYVEPEKVVVVMTQSGLIKRIAATNFRTQRRSGKGVKTGDDEITNVIRTNTIDQLMVFSDKGKMYKILVDDLPIGSNTTVGIPIRSLINIEPDENPTVIYSIYRDTEAKYVLFTTKNGLIKKTNLSEFTKSRKRTGTGAITIKDDDAIVNVNLITDENIMLITANGYVIRFNSVDITPTGRAAAGVKGITLGDGDYVVSTEIIRHSDDELAIFSEHGTCKKTPLSEFTLQRRGGKGIIGSKIGKSNGLVADTALVSDGDNVLVIGDKNSICITADDIPRLGRTAMGNSVLSGNTIVSVSKI